MHWPVGWSPHPHRYVLGLGWATLLSALRTSHANPRSSELSPAKRETSLQYIAGRVATLYVLIHGGDVLPGGVLSRPQLWHCHGRCKQH